MRKIIFTSIEVLLIATLFSSCGTSSSVFSVDYDKAITEVKNSVVKKGIPRSKIYFHFRLLGAKSLRYDSSGLRGGYTAASERWDLPDGYSLVCYKHAYVGRDWKVIPMKPDESWWPPKEKHYREPRLEPYFDSLYLMNAKNKRVAKIELPK